jgi:lipopolysaccharide transport system ATP-binding protein
MSDPVISVENLSKSYLVGHKLAGQGYKRYTALRDVIGQEARNIARNAVNIIRGRQVVLGDQVEEFWALKDVSFELKRGEVLGIIGRNGAGKSTLLKILSRITEPTAGRVTLRGRVASLLEVGTGFHPELTGRENIYLNGAILGMSRAEIRRKFDEIVAFAETEKFLDTPVKRYSSGMYVRLAFAVAAHLEPEILVVDEVLAVGDAGFQEKCLGKMRTLSGTGRTVLFVSHSMMAIRTLCSSCIFLHNGVKAFDGPVSDAIAAYQTYAHTGVKSVWRRPSTLAIPKIGFEQVSVSVHGGQPAIRLLFRMTLRCTKECAPSFVALDVRAATGSVIMQAVPKSTPFLPGKPGSYHLSVQILLPPLIPGTYFTDIWVGPHYNETNDYITFALSFTVEQSPSPGRTIPHSFDHGSIVPISEILECDSDKRASAPDQAVYS